MSHRKAVRGVADCRQAAPAALVEREGLVGHLSR